MTTKTYHLHLFTMIVFLIVVTIAAIVFSLKGVAERDFMCNAAGGELVVLYKSDDLCLGPDGRIILNYKKQN